MKLADFFSHRQFFTHEELVKFLRISKLVNRGCTERSVLEAALNEKRIVRVRQGLYMCVPAGQTPQTTRFDPFLLASMSVHNPIFAYGTALDFHKGFSHAQECFYLTMHKPRKFVFLNHRFEAVSFPTALVRNENECYAVDSIRRGTQVIKVTSLERAVVDCLDRPWLAGGWKNAWASLQYLDFLKLNELIAYALFLENRTTIAKLGFYLESRKRHLAVDDEHLMRLQEHRQCEPVHFIRNRNSRKEHSWRLVSRWNLIVPVEFLEPQTSSRQERLEGARPSRARR